MISFGTDGWRAIIAENFTFSNLRLVSQATANWLLKEHTGSNPPEIVVGYDTRFLSDRFAAEVSCVMAANGIITWLTRTDTPTPAVSFNVKHKNADAGVVITASHNAPRYNGFKVKASYGGAATADQTVKIEAELQTLSDKDVRLMNYEEAISKEIIRRFDPSWMYYQHLSELIDLDTISKGELGIVADGMWGSGRGAFTGILSRTRCHVQGIRDVLNPGFGGIHPEPILKHLNDLVAAVQRVQADVGLATDGDADRIGAIDARGNFIDPHHIFALSLRHLCEHKGLHGDVVKTVSTTLMIDSLAEKYGLKLHETPVGFNHIADLMMSNDVLIGGEESGGISIRGHIPEGDGILMGLLLLEVMAVAHAPLHEIVADLQAKHGPAHYARNDVRLSKQLPKKEMVQKLVDSAPAQINGESVARVDTLDGVKFYLADRSWLLVRPSGTEPVLRIYAEAHTPEAVNALLETGGQMGKSVTQ